MRLLCKASVSSCLGGLGRFGDHNFREILVVVFFVVLVVGFRIGPKPELVVRILSVFLTSRSTGSFGFAF